jgi:two-component system sensor histidine kinase MprB
VIGRFRRGSLRLRAAVVAGVLTTLSIVVVGVAIWVVVAVSLRDATDDELRVTVAAIRTVGLEAVTDDIPGPADEAFGELQEGPARPAVPFVQVVLPDGQVMGADLPIDDEAREVFAGGSGELLQTLDLGEQRIRTLTVALDPGEGARALRVGTDFTSTIDGLRRARTGSLVAGLAAGLLAAAGSWLAAGTLLAPVAAVADAADRLRRNDELPDRLVGEGPDELGRLVTSFNALLDDLRLSRDRQRRLVADVSHELRTPLTSLRVKIEFIQAQPDLAPTERLRLVAGAVADLESLGDLVSELVELASEGASPERAALVELSEVVETEVDRFRVTSGRTVELHTEPGMVETRPKQVTRALSNLLVNADKYSPPTEPITVRQRGPRIEVRDRGSGIPVGDRTRVFERFYRGEAHRSVDGTGLGLAIVAAVARTNGGGSWVEDPADGGPGAVVGFSAGPTADDATS